MTLRNSEGGAGPSLTLRNSGGFAPGEEPPPRAPLNPSPRNPPSLTEIPHLPSLDFPGPTARCPPVRSSQISSRMVIGTSSGRTVNTNGAIDTVHGGSPYQTLKSATPLPLSTLLPLPLLFLPLLLPLLLLLLLLPPALPWPTRPPARRYGTTAWPSTSKSTTLLDTVLIWR